jgi:hypothetical protein
VLVVFPEIFNSIKLADPSIAFLVFFSSLFSLLNVVVAEPEDEFIV